MLDGLAGLNSQTNHLMQGGSGAKPPTGSRGANRMFAQLPHKRRTDAPQHRATGSTLLSPPSPSGEGGRGIGAAKNNLISLQSKRNPHCKVQLGIVSGVTPPPKTLFQQTKPEKIAFLRLLLLYYYAGLCVNIHQCAGAVNVIQIAVGAVAHSTGTSCEGINLIGFLVYLVDIASVSEGVFNILIRNL